MDDLRLIEISTTDVENPSSKTEAVHSFVHPAGAERYLSPSMRLTGRLTVLWQRAAISLSLVSANSHISDNGRASYIILTVT